MKLYFYGAAHEVTGSCSLLEVAGKRLLIDCGMEQGQDIYENQSLPVPANRIDGVLLTHAHIDHSGLLPMLCAQGFHGPICTTAMTHALCNLMLRDSAHIQQSEAEWKNRKAQRAGGEPVTPLYTMEDAEKAISLMQDWVYDTPGELFPGVQLRFVDAGHLMGSASVEVTATENGETRVIVFSGDIGSRNKPILRDPQYVTKADYAVVESTYGDRLHGPEPDHVRELADVIQRTFDRGGNVIIPAFAVGRTQELLYFLREIKAQNLVKGHGEFRVVVDSPLAIEATNVFQKAGLPCFDKDTMALVQAGINPLQFPGLEVSVTSEESKQINLQKDSRVILSASGMCEAGRIRHHLKHNLWRPECTVLFVGYQSAGTLGRALLDGAKTVKLFGENVEVRAEILRLQSISGHADREGLRTWIDHITPAPTRVFVNHGESDICDSMAEELNRRGIPATAPYSGDGWDLLTDTPCAQGSRRRTVKKPRSSTNVFARVLAAYRRLGEVIEENRGGTNKDLAKLASQIQSLCDKWKR